MGSVGIAIAAVIAIGAGLASAAGITTLGLVFVAAGGLLLVSAALWLFGESWFVPRRPESRRRRIPVMLVAAGCAVALIPVVYSAGLAYGASWLEWDAVHSTNVYVERPGGFVVVLVSLVVCVALALFALTTALIITTQAALRRASRV
jgi:hypothetical protein